MGGTRGHGMPLRRRAFLRLLAVMLGGTGTLLILSTLDGLPDVSLHHAPAPATRDHHAPPPRTTCRDVTSLDHNWDNDMLCTRPDGTQFYTSYDGARRFASSRG